MTTATATAFCPYCHVALEVEAQPRRLQAVGGPLVVVLRTAPHTCELCR